MQIAIPIIAIGATAFLVVALGVEIGAIMYQLTPWLEKIPWVGGKIADIAKGMAQAISHACGLILNPISDLMGGVLHQTARLVDWTYGTMRQHASLLLGITSFLGPLALSVAGLRALVHSFVDVGSGTQARVKRLEKEYKGIEAQIKHLEKEFKGIDDTGIRKQLNTLDAEIGSLEAQTIPAITTTADNAYSDVTALTKWITGSVSIPRSLTFASVVAIALGSLGLGGLRCSNFRGLLSKFGCGLGTLLNDLLGIVIAGLVLESVCEFLPLIEDAFGAIAGPLTHVLNEVPLGACETPPSGWAKLSVAAGPLPPAQSLGTLAS